MSDESTPLCSPKEIPIPFQRKPWSANDTEELLIFTEQNEEVSQAANLLRDVILLSQTSSELAHTDYTISRVSRSNDTVSRWCSKVVNHPFFLAVFHTCLLGLILLSFFEPPPWCRGFDDGDTDSMNGCELALNLKGVPAFYTDDSESRIQEYYPNTGTNILTVSQSLKLEWLCMIVILTHTILSFGKDDFSLKNYFIMGSYESLNLDTLTSKYWKVIRVVRFVRIGSILLLIGGMSSFSLFSEHRPFAVFLRMIIYVTYSYGVLRELLVAVEVIPSILSVATVLLMVNVFYALIGVASFSGTKEGDECFSNLIEGMWTLWTSMTTVIYPVSYSRLQSQMHDYEERKYTHIYFLF